MLMTKNDNGNGNKVLCKVRKEWQRMVENGFPSV